MVQFCMNKQHVFVATSDSSNDVGHIFILDRRNGQKSLTILDAHCHCIYGIQVFQHLVLASADNWGTIKFQKIDLVYQREISTIYEEDRYIESL